MAPRASTSKQRAASPAGSSSGSEGGSAPRGNGKQQQDRGAGAAADDDELDHDAELDALELKDPLRTCRHLFLQALIARKTLPLDRAKALYQECVRLCNGALSDVSRSRGPQGLARLSVASRRPGNSPLTP